MRKGEKMFRQFLVLSRSDERAAMLMNMRRSTMQLHGVQGRIFVMIWISRKFILRRGKSFEISTDFKLYLKAENFEENLNVKAFSKKF